MNSATTKSANPSLAAPAELARAALRHLAERRLPPTPDQYSLAWRAVGGSIPDGRGGADAAAALPQIGQAIAEVLRQLDTTHRHWTSARKKEALGRVLALHGSDPRRLSERLQGLVDSWREAPKGTTLESVEPDPVADGAQAAVHAAAPVCAATPGHAATPVDAAAPVDCTAVPEAGERVAALGRVLADMTELLVAVCDAVPRMVEEEAWVRRQFESIRAMLDPARGLPDPQDLAHARELLGRTVDEHQRLLKMRRDSLQMMKTMIAQCIDWLGTLTASSGRFGSRLGSFIEEIERSSDLPSLAGTVRHLIEETRAMYVELEGSREDFTQAGERARQLEEEVSRLETELSSASVQVNTDHLTGLLNRRGLERSFAELAARCRADGRPLSLAMIDVDNFKRLNDVLGHQAGDDALRHLARVTRSRLRSEDLGARYGGEEFVVVLPGVIEEQAAEAVHRIQRALTTDVFTHDGQWVAITFSAGVAQVQGAGTLEEVAARADQAMYEAKRTGRNRVCIASHVLGK
ncbi:MAG: GGDEF domain-containing protein [Burkholderiaceae bacterium]|nr:GGDEF domain-containing protein [Burkholderiaceae bacterium]MEB2352487.1 GGDEF domain-containing protein [Burkholderiaceae bacterium]